MTIKARVSSWLRSARRFEEKRNADRYVDGSLVQVRSEACAPLVASLLDVSATGARLSAVGRLHVGTTVWCRNPMVPNTVLSMRLVWEKRAGNVYLYGATLESKKAENAAAVYLATLCVKAKCSA